MFLTFEDHILLLSMHIDEANTEEEESLLLVIIPTRKLFLKKNNEDKFRILAHSRSKF